jgi:hypothetical protein
MLHTAGVSDRDAAIGDLIEKRSEARRKGAYDLADELKSRLLIEFGIGRLSDHADFSTGYEAVKDSDVKPVNATPLKVVAKKSSVSGRRRKALRKAERRVDTKGRGLAFATFLVETFGAELLRSGTVVDVAGGRGDTSWELALQWNIKCCIIDPQGLRLSKNRQKIVLCRSCAVGSVTGGKYQDSLGADAASAAVSSASVFGSAVAGAGSVLTVNNADYVVDLEEEDEQGGGAAVADRKVSMLELERCLGITQQQRLFVPQDACQEVVRDCSLLAGLHADEATELIVDAALEAGKPFAIVPCCVFPRLFPHRTLPTGEQVRSLDSFLSYLQLKDPGIQRAMVPNMLPPTNTVLFKFGR